jgi:hypothetical protein
MLTIVLKILKFEWVFCGRQTAQNLKRQWIGIVFHPCLCVMAKRLRDVCGLKERWYPIQVKQKDKAGRPDIDAFEAMMMREDCEKGFFVSFDYSSDALSEIESFFKRSHKVIVALTVQEILDEHIAKKLV